MVVRREMEGYSPAVSRRDLLAVMVAAVSLPLTIAITLAVTILLDLTQAILLGSGISTLVFMAQISELEITRQSVDPYHGM